MAHIFSREELIPRGFTTFEPAVREDLDLPTSTSGEARGLVVPAVALDLILSAAVPWQFLSARSEIAEKGGAEIAFLKDDPAMVRLSTLRGDEDLSVQRGPAVRQIAGDGGTLYWDTRLDRRLVAWTSSGGIAIEAASDRLVVEALAALPQSGELAEIDAPLVEWAQQCGDAWMAEQLRLQFVVGGSWNMTVGAGMLARLLQPDAGEIKAAGNLAAARAILIRDAREPRVWPLLWASMLSEASCRTLEAFALAECDALSAALERFEVPGVEPSDAHMSDWRRLCRRRDDCACVALILHEAGSVSPAFGRALEHIDREGQLLASDVPRNASPHDERSRRTLLVEPMAWWTS